MINFKDVNGKWVCLTRAAFFDVLIDNIDSIVGISVPAILEFRTIYDERGGSMPITEDSIREIFK